MVRYHGGHDSGGPVRVLPIEFHLEGELDGPVECVPVNPWGRSKSRQWLAIVALVVLDVRLNHSDERVNRRLDGAASGRQIVLQRSGGPGAMCFWKHDDSETAGRQCHMRNVSAPEPNAVVAVGDSSVYTWASNRKPDSR